MEGWRYLMRGMSRSGFRAMSRCGELEEDARLNGVSEGADLRVLGGRVYEMNWKNGNTE